MTKPGARTERILARVLLVLLAVTGTLGAVELGARAHLHWIAPASVAQRYAAPGEGGRRAAEPQRIVRHHYLGHLPRPNFYDGKDRHDTRGFRGEGVAQRKPAGEFRIVCVGGSTTYGTGVDDFRHAYPAQLEAALHAAGYPKVRVVNAGVPGWTSWESLLAMPLRVLPLEPDLVVVHHGLNDAIARMVWPPEAYAPDNGGYLAPVASPPHSWLAHSALARFFLIRTGRLPAADRLDSHVLTRAESFADLLLAAPERLARDGFLQAGETTDAAMRRLFANNPPRYFEQNLRDLNTLAASRGAVVLFATFAVAEAAAPQFARYLRPPLRDALAEHNAVLRRIASGTDAALFDFAATFPTTDSLFTDGIHLTAEGNRLKAAAFADAILASGALGPPP